MPVPTFPVFVMIAVIGSGVGQSQASANGLPLELDGTPQRPILLGAREVIRAANDSLPPDDSLPQSVIPMQQLMPQRLRIYDGMVNVQLTVVINENGRVESAKPIRGPQRFYEQAAELEEHRAFIPIRDKNGTVVRAHFTDTVSVGPPERWLEHSAVFPEHVDLGTFRVALNRTGCFGSCPSYKVTVVGSGDVLWDGRTDVRVRGTERTKISQEAVKALVDQVRGSRFLSAQDRYESRWTDFPVYTVTVDFNGLHKQVVDYIGTIVGMPTSIVDLEESIDRIAGTEKWIKGDADLIP